MLINCYIFRFCKHFATDVPWSMFLHYNRKTHRLWCVNVKRRARQSSVLMQDSHSDNDLFVILCVVVTCQTKSSVQTYSTRGWCTKRRWRRKTITLRLPKMTLPYKWIREDGVCVRTCVWLCFFFEFVLMLYILVSLYISCSLFLRGSDARLKMLDTGIMFQYALIWNTVKAQENVQYMLRYLYDRLKNVRRIVTLYIVVPLKYRLIFISSLYPFPWILLQSKRSTVQLKSWLEQRLFW